jgi:hypothetical protein
MHCQSAEHFPGVIWIFPCFQVEESVEMFVGTFTGYQYFYRNRYFTDFGISVVPVPKSQKSIVFPVFGTGSTND